MPATIVVGFVLSLAACTQPLGQPSSSPSDSTNAAASPTASGLAIPSGTPTGGPVATLPSPSTAAGTPLAVISLPFHPGEVGISYGPINLVASGGQPPYQWSVGSGALPQGTAVSSGGTVSGTPTTKGHFVVAMKVTDSTGRSASRGATGDVYAHLALAAPCTTQCSVEEGCTVCGTFGTATGGVPPLKYAVVGGSVPSPGMGLSGLKLSGPFAGNPNGWDLTVRVTDALGVSGQVHAYWYVFAHIAFTITSATCTQNSAACSTQLTYTGGTPNGKPTLKIGKFLDAKGQPEAGPPNGFSAVASGGTVNVSAGGQNYFATVTLILVDQSVCGPASTHCSSNTATVTIRL